LLTLGKVFGKQSAYREIFVQLGPVDADTAADEAPVAKKLRAGVAALCVEQLTSNAMDRGPGDPG
jgi:hypothetical protein